MTKEKQQQGNLQWWQLSLIGVGCIIGTGFFLGSGLAIRMSGISVLIAFLVAATGTYIVYSLLARMSAADPQEGSFRTYAKKAYGPWAGFTSGWVYWSSEILIMGSQLTALSLFTKFWFKDTPLWVFASVYAVLGIIVVLLGSHGFEKIENLFGVIKIAAILMFIIIAILGLFGVISGGNGINMPYNMGEFIPKGVHGLWAALIFGFYAFGGIEIMGIMATRLKDKDEAPKAGKVMLLVLTIIYLVSIALAVSMTPLNKFNGNESPFITALSGYHDLTWVPHLFMGALIIAGFSTMSASLFAITSMLVTLAKDGDAPERFAKKGKLKVPILALGVTVAGLLASIITALLLPNRIYEYITTAAGLMLLYNWVFVLFSSSRLLELTLFDQIKRFTGMALILLAVSGTLLEKSSRPGLFLSLGFIVVIVATQLIMHFSRKRKPKHRFDPQEA